jgi:hypothetical protein
MGYPIAYGRGQLDIACQRRPRSNPVLASKAPRLVQHSGLFNTAMNGHGLKDPGNVRDFGQLVFGAIG